MTRGGFDPRGFYRVALEVAAAHREDESYRRTAVARAYYACFHLARHGLERGGRWSAGTVNVHERVLQELLSRRRTGIANGLRVLRRLGYLDKVGSSGLLLSSSIHRVLCYLLRTM